MKHKSDLGNLIDLIKVEIPREKLEWVIRRLYFRPRKHKVEVMVQSWVVMDVLSEMEQVRIFHSELTILGHREDRSSQP